MTETSQPPTKIEICLSGNIPLCVSATDESKAKMECYTHCKTKNQMYQTEADNSPTKNWNPSFPCDNFLNSLIPAVAEDPKTMCAGGGPVSAGPSKPEHGKQ